MNNLVRKKLMDNNTICFTMDLDWAPECAIEKTIGRFVDAGIRPTVFVTHGSAVVEKFRESIDLGIHPNFIQPSSQGDNLESIIDYCLGLVPNAKVFRSHRWYSDNDIYEYLVKKGIKYESNLCTYLDVIPPFVHRSGMICFPTFFEDGAYIINSPSLSFADLKDYFVLPGIKVINMHPMHYAVNTPYFTYMRSIKDRLSREEWNTMDEDTLSGLSFKGDGIKNVIDEMIDYSIKTDANIMTLDELYHELIH